MQLAAAIGLVAVCAFVTGAILFWYARKCRELSASYDSWEANIRYETKAQMGAAETRFNNAIQESASLRDRLKSTEDKARDLQETITAMSWEAHRRKQLAEMFVLERQAYDLHSYLHGLLYAAKDKPMYPELLRLASRPFTDKELPKDDQYHPFYIEVRSFVFLYETHRKRFTDEYGYGKVTPPWIIKQYPEYKDVKSEELLTMLDSHRQQINDYIKEEMKAK